MKRRIPIILIVVVALVLLVGIGARLGSPVQNAQRYITGTVDDYAVSTMVAMQPAAARYAAESEGMLMEFAAEEQAQTQDRLVIRNATLTLLVDAPDAKLFEISTIASEYGGWVVSADAYRSGTGEEARITSAAITIRVEADQLDEALARIKDGVQSVEYENVTGQDVTQQYVDLTSQLSNLQAAEQQLQAIMDDARRTEDVLSVYSQLVNIRGQIEQIRGQMQYFEQSAAYSSIQITIRPTPITQPIEIAGWRPQETARNAFQAFIDLLQGVADVAITVAVFGLPVLVVFGIPAWLIYRRYRKTRNAALQTS